MAPRTTPPPAPPGLVIDPRSYPYRVAVNGAAGWQAALDDAQERAVPLYIPPTADEWVIDAPLLASAKFSTYGEGRLSTLRQDTFGQPVFKLSAGASESAIRACRLLNTQPKTDLGSDNDIAELASAVWVQDCSQVEVAELLVEGFVYAVNFKGPTSADVAVFDALNRVVGLRTVHVDFGVLFNRQDGLSIAGLGSDATDFSQPSKPPHSIYATGSNATSPVKRSRNVLIEGVVVRDNAFAAALKLKFCDGLTVSGATMHKVERGVDFQDSTGIEADELNVVSMVAADPDDPDTPQAAITILDCQGGRVAGRVNVGALDGVEGVTMRSRGVGGEDVTVDVEVVGDADAPGAAYMVQGQKRAGVRPRYRYAGTATSFAAVRVAPSTEGATPIRCEDTSIIDPVISGTDRLLLVDPGVADPGQYSLHTTVTVNRDKLLDGVSGSAIVDGTGANAGELFVEVDHAQPKAITADNPTPNVALTAKALTNSTVATTYTDLANGHVGQIVELMGADALTTIEDGGNFVLTSGSWHSTTRNAIRLLKQADGKWRELSRTAGRGFLTIGPTGSGADFECDGSADEVQINAAIVEASARGGGVVHPLAGTYRVTGAPIRFLSNVWVEGEGPGITTIQSADGLNTHLSRNDDWINGNSNFGYRRLTLDGNKVGQVPPDPVADPPCCLITDAGGGVGARGVGVGLDEVEVINAYGHGAHFQRTDRVRVGGNCHFDANGTTTLHHAIYLIDCDETSFAETLSENNAGNGLNAKEGDTIDIARTFRAVANGGRGVRIADYFNATCDATAIANLDVGILYTLEIAQGVVGGAIGGYTKGNRREGIYVNDSANVDIAGYAAIENKFDGVRVRNTVRFSIGPGVSEGNSIDQPNTCDAIRVEGTSAHGTVTGNDCRRTTVQQRYALSLLDSVDYITVIANNFAENFSGAINDASSGLNNTIHSNGGADNPDPVGAHDFATKQYVDGLVQGMDVKQSVRVAYATNQALTGAAAAEGGTTPANGERVLLTGQTAAAQNGVYVVNTGGAWSRATDADAWSELGGAIVPVEAGTYANHIAILIAPSGGTLGSTAITVTVLQLATDLVAGAALSRTGTTLDVNTDNTTVEVSGDALRVVAGGIKETQLGAAILKSSTPTFVSNAYTIVAGDAWKVLLVDPAADSVLTLATPGSLGLADGAVIRVKKNGTAPGRVTVTDGADQAWLSANGDVVEVRNNAGTWVVAWHAIQPLFIRHITGAGNDVIPPLYTAVLSIDIAGGGGGGAGPRRNATIARSGGAAGAPGGISMRWIPRSELGEPGANVAYSVGAGGAGGAAVTTDDTSGNVGAAGGATTWGPNRAGGGAGGGAGGTGSATGGGTTSQATVPMVGGGSTTTTANAVQPTSGNGGGGGGGGGLTAAGVSLTPSSGANGSVTSSTQVTAGAAGTVGSTAGGNGSDVATATSQLGGAGGGGGYAAAGAVGGAGGNGGQGGGGGGGGAASDNGKNSGKGGDGGSGETRALWVF